MRLPLIALLAAILLLGGCSSTPVRHLASDAALVTPGQSTEDEMRKYLGEPNGQRDIAPGVREYVYHEDQPGLFGSMPLLGSATGPAGYEMIVVTVSQGLVTDCEFRTFNKSDDDWRDDYTWKKVE
ncbi:MAG: hypothetical protein ACOX5Z_04355 [Desulfobulbus sp.]|jgi:hypothetical protein